MRRSSTATGARPTLSAPLDGLLEQVHGSAPKDRLLVGSLGLDEPHARARDGFADRLSITRIVLLPLHIRLHIGRRHQANRVT